MGLTNMFGSQDPISMIFGGGTFGGINETKQGKELRDQSDLYRAQIMSVTDPRAEAAGWSMVNPYQTPQAQAMNWQQAPVTNMQAAQGRAMQGQAMSANAAQAQGAQLDLGQANQTREGQNALISSLQGTAAGQGPSVAQEQLRQSTAQNVANQASAAQSAHGAARLAALRNASQQQAQIQQQANSQAAGLRAQEIASAQGQLGQSLGLTRSQDIGAASTNAQLAQQSGQFNAGNQQATNLANAQFGNQMALANLGYGNQMGIANLGNQQMANQFNAGAANTAGLNYAQQSNQGNLALGLANLNAQQQANLLDLQRKQAMYGVTGQALAGNTDIYKTLYGGQMQQEKNQQENNKGLIGETMGMMGSMGFGGGLGSLF
jgi:hypothetical protein